MPNRAEIASGSRPWPALFAQEMDSHAAAMRMMAMFPEVNPLPGAQRQLAAFERDAEIHRGKRRAHVRRHVILAFSRMPENWVAIRRKPRKQTLQVALYFRISILLNEQRRRRVLQMQRSDARL